MMNQYIIFDQGQYHLIGDTEMPSQVICRAPEGENIQWLDIVDDNDPEAEFPKKAVVNAARKAAVLSAMADDKAARAVQATKQSERMQRLKLVYNNMDIVVADPVKLEKLLKEMLITIANLGEE